MCQIIKPVKTAVTRIILHNIAVQRNIQYKYEKHRRSIDNFLHQTKFKTFVNGGGGGGGGGKPQKYIDEFYNRFSPITVLIICAINSPISKAAEEREINTETVAIVIPVLNEIKCIQSTLEILQNLNPASDKIIVVDGGSTDGTLKILKQNRKMIQLIQSGRGRALQQNIGASNANTDYVCFLHADTVPPMDLVSVIRKVFRNNRRVVAGGFKVSIEVPGNKLHFTSFHNNIKSFLYPIIFRPLSFIRGIRLLFGDQVIFVRNKEFLKVGGFDEKLALMEEADLVVRMHNQGPLNMKGRGKIQFVSDRLVVTSGRRIYELGETKALFIHMLIGVSWYFGADANFLQNLKNNLYQDSFR
eukprot:TRINITY_DN5066_c0_g1_i4.p1 TRINITY_DN5066_c0_g1~~TRINITY_DN5066_c0_g1_i4.p1  ORF type:complete len:358 (+),score=35.50 TRINITY_DN5066_c0_g1_i4:142-1215(+)